MTLSLDFQGFKKLALKGNLVAVTKTVPADLETPVSSFLKLTQKENYAFLLESAEQGEKVGRYSFIGLKPSQVFISHRRQIQVIEGAKQSVIKDANLLDVLEARFKQLHLANPESIPGFCGGFMGYLSYEQVQNFESVKLAGKPDAGIPDGVFFQVQDLLIFDHFRKSLTFAVIVKTDGALHPLKKRYNLAVSKIKAYEKALQKPLSLSKIQQKITRIKPVSNISKQAFIAKVKKIKEYIRAGDCIQVVLSQRFSLPATAHDFQIYRALRSINPSPYMFYFKSGSLRLVGSSPELLVKKTGREAEVRPIAGTRPRGLTPKEDLAFEDSLKKSIKEMAEHLMLVDLGRNDIGRVCEFNSIQVKKFARVERYSHVMHLVSDVTGKLKSGQNGFDLLRATFPAGTVTGAPKVRAMQIIHELEPEARGPYAGCLGFFSFNQDMEMCITIRTLVVQKNKISLQAGAGIVKDSVPENEYLETVNKAKALLKAIEQSGAF